MFIFYDLKRSQQQEFIVLVSEAMLEPQWPLGVQDLGYYLHDVPRTQMIWMLALFDGNVIHQMLPLQNSKYTLKCMFTYVLN
jgi:hypothetical protein